MKAARIKCMCMVIGKDGYKPGRNLGGWHEWHPGEEEESLRKAIHSVCFDVLPASYPSGAKSRHDPSMDFWEFDCTQFTTKWYLTRE